MKKKIFDATQVYIGNTGSEIGDKNIHKIHILTMQTRLFKIIQQIFFSAKRKFQRFQEEFTNNILYLFIGFITGSTFGAFLLSCIRMSGLWDVAIISILLIWFEEIGKRVYKRNRKKRNQLKLINCWKTGMILGFFIDAFKVGS